MSKAPGRLSPPYFFLSSLGKIIGENKEIKVVQLEDIKGEQMFHIKLGVRENKVDKFSSIMNRLFFTFSWLGFIKT